MKEQFRLVTLPFCLAAVLIYSLIIIQPVAARDRNSEHVTFNNLTMVAGTMLEPGTYNVVWEGPGPQVRVSFEKGLKVVLITTAQMTEGGPYHGVAEVRRREDNTRILQRITWHNKSLIFSASS